MKCKTCPVKGFVHADLYCRGCPDKPKPKIKTGRAYLFLKNAFQPVTSVEIKAADGFEYEVSAIELMRRFKIEFIAHDSDEIVRIIHNEINGQS